MSKEHVYAYEAGYRDGSIHYELEHCPACKNVADLQEVLADNAKLQDELEFANDQCERAILELLDQQGQLEAENAKLRELVRDIWRFTGTACKKYPRLFDPTAQGAQVVLPNMIDAFEQRMRELGVEVDDG